MQFLSELFSYILSKQGLVEVGIGIVNMLIGAHVYWLWFVKGRK